MITAERDLYVVVEDRGEDGAVLVLYQAGDKIPDSHADLPRLAATFDTETSRWLPGEPLVASEAPPARRRRGRTAPPETKEDIL